MRKTTMLIALACLTHFALAETTTGVTKTTPQLKVTGESLKSTPMSQLLERLNAAAPMGRLCMCTDKDVEDQQYKPYGGVGYVEKRGPDDRQDADVIRLQCRVDAVLRAWIRKRQDTKQHSKLSQFYLSRVSSTSSKCGPRVWRRLVRSMVASRSPAGVRPGQLDQMLEWAPGDGRDTIRV